MADKTVTTSKGAGATGSYIMAGVQILSGFLQADQVKRQADMQARIAEFNAQLAEYDSWKVEAYGQTMTARMQNNTDQVNASTKVFAASKGIKIEGSLADVQAENELNSMLNKIDMDNRTTEQAMGYKRQASQIRLGSEMNNIATGLQASSLRLGGIAQGVGTIASTMIRNQEIKKDDLNLPKETPSGYSSFSPNKFDGSSTNKSVHGWGVSLMPGGY